MYTLHLKVIGRFCLLCLEYCKWCVANEDIEGIEGTVLTAVQAVGSASSVLASVDDVTATAIAISLADLLESKFPGCCSGASGLEVCPKFKEVFEQRKLFKQ